MALVACVVTAERMEGMDSGPGSDLGALGWYVGVWVTMMAAMMLPSVAPRAFLFARVSAESARRGQAAFVPTWIFLAGYFAAWTVYGIAAYGVYRGVASLDLGFLAWGEQGPVVAGAGIAAACWGLMLVLFALGVMSVFWMAVVAAVVFAEKVTPFGARLHRPLAVVLVALGLWVAVAPGSVPGLTEPGSGPATRMEQMEP